jgi:hypothetical protein
MLLDHLTISSSGAAFGPHFTVPILPSVLHGHPLLARLSDMIIGDLNHQNFLIPRGPIAMRIATWPMIPVIPCASPANITVLASNRSVVATLDPMTGELAIFFASEAGCISIKASRPTSLECYSVLLWQWDCSSVYLNTSLSEKFVGLFLAQPAKKVPTSILSP